MSRNCIEIVQPFVDGLETTDNLQIVGGIGSFVLQNAGVEIRSDEKLVVAPPDLDYSAIGQFRPDGNRRDFDLLVKSSRPEAIEAVEGQAKEVIGSELVISVFGLHGMNQLEGQRAHPRRSLAKVWVADRYVTETDGQITAAKKALFPFAVDMHPATLENWQLLIGKNRTMPIPHPGTVVLNYLTRSVSGLRPKDADKIQELAANVFSKAPEIADWIVDGPGSSQLDLARILQSLPHSRNPQALVVGQRLEVTPYHTDLLAHHPALMVRPNSPLAAQSVALSCVKAEALHFFEKNQRIVTAYQRYAEKYFGFIIGNR